MIAEIIELDNLVYEKVRYYSIKLEGRAITEYADFQNRMSVKTQNQIELSEINRYIELIGEKLGAFPAHFKNEDSAERLPPPYHHFFESDDPNDYGLRLYCIRVTPFIVILLNGDRKTSLKVQHCANCYKHFNLARKLADVITKGLQIKDIEIDEWTRELIVYEDLFIT